MPVDFAAILQVKLWKSFVTAIALNYALLLSQWSYGHYLKVTDSILFEQDDKSSRHLTQRIISGYTHKMATVSWP